MSSDGHRWLTGQYTTENEETHWPASYGGKRNDSGDDPEVIENYPDASGSPTPTRLPSRTTTTNTAAFISTWTARQELRQLRQRLRVRGDRRGPAPSRPAPASTSTCRWRRWSATTAIICIPTYNTHIPDAPLPEDPDRFNRFGRFKQVFEARFVDRRRGVCKLPQFVDLYYPNDHGGGARDINPNGPDWSFKRFVQDNDAALGLTVELLSNSPCWKDTVIFVVEDDTQNGADHVDGHRSIFLAISPWVKKQNVSKTHTSLASIFKTVNLILGLPPLNQYDAAATDLRDMFTGHPDFTPYNVQPVQFAQQVNPLWLALTRDIDFSRPDRGRAQAAGGNHEVRGSSARHRGLKP